jgi:hypothetical protein
MILARADQTETVFHMFAARARGRSRHSLAVQLGTCASAAVSLVLVAPAWWPMAAMLGAYAGFAAWGLVDRGHRSLGARFTLRAIATMTTVLVLMAVTGAAFAAFTGDGPSPYGTCYEPGGRAFACDARGARRP